MKKYKTTSEHPYLQEGIILKPTSASICNNSIFIGLDDNWLVTDILIDGLLKEGEIKEIQEKEFTKDDLYELSDYLYDNYNSDENHEIVNGWLKTRK